MKKIVFAIMLAVMVISAGCQQANQPTSVVANTSEPTSAVANASEPTSAVANTSEPTSAVESTTIQLSDEAIEKPAITLVTGTGGLGDLGFNDMGWDGTQRAGEDFGLKATVTEPQSLSDLQAIHMSNAKAGIYLLDIGIGYEQQTAIDAAAAAFPDQKFLIVDNVVDQPNVESIIFRHRESAFLMGVLAAQMSESKIIGIIEAEDPPTTHECYVSMVAGAKWVDPDIKILFALVGSWNDPTKAYELAQSQYNQGADVIWQVAGGSGLGVFEAAKDLNFYTMGTDVNQNGLDPDHIIASFIKNVDNAIYLGVQTAAEGKFEGGTTYLGIKEGGMDMTWEGTNVSIPEAYQQKVLEAKEKIVSGEIVPPFSDDDLTAYLTSIGQ